MFSSTIPTNTWRVYFYPTRQLVRMAVQIFLGVCLWNTHMEKAWAPGESPDLSLGSEPPSHLGILAVETTLGQLSPQTSTGWCWWPGAPAPCTGRDRRRTHQPASPRFRGWSSTNREPGTGPWSIRACLGIATEGHASGNVLRPRE